MESTTRKVEVRCVVPQNVAVDGLNVGARAFRSARCPLSQSQRHTTSSNCPMHRVLLRMRKSQKKTAALCSVPQDTLVSTYICAAVHVPCAHPGTVPSSCTTLRGHTFGLDQSAIHTCLLSYYGLMLGRSSTMIHAIDH